METQPGRKHGDPGNPKPKTISNYGKKKEVLMKKSQIQNYEMLTRVVEFTTTNVSLFPKTSAAAEILEGLQSTVRRLSEQASAQMASEGALQASRTARAAARDALTRRLVLTEQVARALHSDNFPVPIRRRDHDLISSGHAFVENGAPLSKEFTKHALPLNELTAAVDALERANLDYSSGRARRAAAIQEFRSTTTEAMGYLQRLEAIVEMTLADNPTAIVAWTVARTVARVAVRKREAKPADPAANPVPAALAAAA
jgi:chorismate mutase